MYPENVISEMAKSGGDADRLVSACIGEVLSLVEKYRRLGYSFTFSGTGDTDREVNSFLARLSDDMLEAAEDRARSAVAEAGDEEDTEEILSWIRENRNPRQTLDSYASHLKYILEGWIAISFTNGITQGRLLPIILSYMDNPYSSPLWQSAFKEGQMYASGIIAGGGYRWGKGVPISPEKGLSRVGQDIINTAYNRGVIGRYGKAGAIGYTVHRGSSYDCPVCDALCGRTHPITSIVLPAHSRCVCFTTPVYENASNEHIRKRRTEIRREAVSLTVNEIVHPDSGIRMTLSKTGIKEWLNQPHRDYLEKNEMLLSIGKVISGAKYVGYGHDKHNPLAKAHLFEVVLSSGKSWIIAIEDKSGCRLHSISDSEDILKIIEK